MKVLWKREGNKKTSNIRPIMLQNAIGKITSKIIARRLRTLGEGFLNEKGTANAICTLTNLWEDAKENKKTCLNMLYDLRNENPPPA
jgi:hypothetical protein